MSEILREDLTTLTTDGTGLFDELMQSTKAHLKEEYESNRIRGADYARVYVESLSIVMQQSVSFLLARQQADKQAELLEQQTANAEKEGLILDQQLLKLTADTALVEQTVLNTKAQEDLLKENLKTAEEQTRLVEEQHQQIAAQTAQIPEQTLKLVAERQLIEQQRTNAVTQNTTLVKQQDKLDSEKAILDQKKLTEEAQILDRVSGAGADVAGVIGKQKVLYANQAEGFIRDAEQKAASTMADVWSVRRSTDVNNTPASTVTGFDDESIGEVIQVLKSGIGT